MVQDVARLADIFQRIDAECGIIGFDYQKNPVNFLTIKHDGFVGSEVGSMNLRHPDRWQGPYLQDNSTIHSKEYQIVRTKKGYFITPGDGVRLPNNKVVGKDIILDEHADIPALVLQKDGLNFEGKPLAAPLKGYKAEHGHYQELPTDDMADELAEGT
jgi:hypothetical protein